MSRVFRASPSEGESTTDTRRRSVGGTETGVRRLEEEARVKEARVKETEILNAAHRKAEALRAEGQRKGIEEGFAAGYSVGLEQGKLQIQVDLHAKAQADFNDLHAALTNMLQAVEAQHQAFGLRVRRDLVELAVKMAEKIVQAHVLLDPEAVLRSCERAVELTVQKSHLEIFVHPRDCDRIKEYLPALHAKFAQLHAVAVRPDESIDVGGCRVKSREGAVDADIHAQLDVLRRALLPEAAPAVAPAAALVVGPVGLPHGVRPVHGFGGPHVGP